MKIFLLFYMCHFAMGLTHCYKTTVFFTFISVYSLFQIVSGVRQGGVLSRCLSVVFIDSIITSDKGGGICFCPRLSVCLLARLLKNACMDLDEMLRDNRCRDTDELINV